MEKDKSISDYWPTKDEDMSKIAIIIQKHVDRNGKINIFLDSYEYDDRKVNLVIPNWVLETIAYLKERHGERKGLILVRCVYQELGFFRRP